MRIGQDWARLILGIIATGPLAMDRAGAERMLSAWDVMGLVSLGDGQNECPALL